MPRFRRLKLKDVFRTKAGKKPAHARRRAMPDDLIDVLDKRQKAQELKHSRTQLAAVTDAPKPEKRGRLRGAARQNAKEWAMRLMAVGTPLTHVEEETQIPLAALKAMLRDAETKQKIEEIRSEIYAGTAHSVMHRIANEAHNSIETLVSLRDGAEEESVRFRSAKELKDDFLDRALPKSGGDAETTTRIVFESADLKELATLLESVRELKQLAMGGKLLHDLDPIDTDELDDGRGGKVIVPRTIEELINELPGDARQRQPEPAEAAPAS